MNITILLDRSYKSVATSPRDCTRTYSFLREMLGCLSIKTKNKFRIGAYGCTTSFLCRMKNTIPKDKDIRTDFVYEMKAHLDTPHQVWTEDTKAELLFLLKGQPFQTQGYNNVREILEQVTQGSAEMAADHVVIIACWPLYESRDMLSVMRQTASVYLINLNKHWVTPEKVAKKLKTMSSKYLVAKKNKSRTPYEELQLSMFTFLRERAPVLLEEMYGKKFTDRQLHSCATQESGCFAKTCY